MSEQQQAGKENAQAPTAVNSQSISDAVERSSKIVDLIDNFSKEIKERCAKEIEIANKSYIQQGEYAEKTQIVIDSLQKISAFQMTSLFSSSLERVIFSDQTAADIAAKRKGSSELEEVTAGLKCDIEAGMKAIKSFDKLRVTAKEFCSKLKQWCRDLELSLRANKLQESIAALTVTEMGVIIAVVIGITAIVLATLRFSDISFIEISVMVVVVAGVIAFIIAKRMVMNHTKNIYSATVDRLKAMKTAVMSFRGILYEFEIAERKSICLAESILGLIKQYETQVDKATVSDKFIFSLSSKCKELQEAITTYKTKVAEPIKKLDQLAKKPVDEGEEDTEQFIVFSPNPTADPTEP